MTSIIQKTHIKTTKGSRILVETRQSKPSEGRKQSQYNTTKWEQYRIILLPFLVVDHCYNQPCFKRGACVNSVDGYQCNCHEGFQGRNCQGMCPLYLKNKTKNKNKNPKTKTKKKQNKTKQSQDKNQKRLIAWQHLWIRQSVRNSHTIISGSKG